MKLTLFPIYHSLFWPLLTFILASTSSLYYYKKLIKIQKGKFTKKKSSLPKIRQKVRVEFVGLLVVSILAIFLASYISLDLVKKDFITNEGKIMEVNSFYKNAYKTLTIKVGNKELAVNVMSEDIRCNKGLFNVGKNIQFTYAKRSNVIIKANPN